MSKLTPLALLFLTGCMSLGDSEAPPAPPGFVSGGDAIMLYMRTHRLDFATAVTAMVA